MQRETSTHKFRSVSWIGVIVLAALIGGYVGAYYATVRPSRDVDWLFTAPTGIVVVQPGPEYADFLSSSLPTEEFFTPIHWLDRRIRPQVWKPMP